MGTENKRMKTVTVLLTQYSDIFGRFISVISRNSYSHASISIDDEEELFYSFNYRGFAIEKPKQHKLKERMVGSVCIRMQVPEETYELIEKEINLFIQEKERFRYSRCGVILCLLHIPHKFKNRYFCSQFVAEVLLQAGAVELEKKESLYLPGELLDGMDCPFSTKQLVYDLV